MALASIFVIDMANEYGIDSMVNEFEDKGTSSLGSDMITDIEDDMGSMKNNTNIASGSFALITGAIKGVGSILKTMILAPVTVKNTLMILMESVGIPGTGENSFGLASIIGNMVMLLLYSLVIFVIVSSLLKGGKV